MKKIRSSYWSRYSKMLLYIKTMLLLAMLPVVTASASPFDSGVANESSLQQDGHTVTGTVVDTNGMPLPGVSVVIKGTTTGTITDFDGNYSLKLESKDAVVVFSFIGFVKQEVVVGDNNTLNITLEDETLGLDEVVVVGYGAQQKKTLSGSVGNISSENITARPAANTTELLQGQVAGLTAYQASGLPGDDGAKLSIRGFGSPLVLIDGMEGNLAHVDPNDIESISVLKDAAAAIYGARAGNGVVLVTTKRGGNKDAQINYHGTISFTNLTYMPERVNAGQWAELMHESGQDPTANSPAHVEYDAENNRLINTLDGSTYKGYDWKGAIIKDWQAQQQHNISASGGTDKIKYFVSVGFTDQESNFNSGDYSFNRYNVRSNIDAQITDNLSVGVNLTYRENVLDKANFTMNDMFVGLETANPTYPVVHEADPTRATYSGFLERSPYYITMKDQSGWIKDKNNAIQGALEFKYDFPMVKGLSAKARLGYEQIFIQTKNVRKPMDVWDYNQLEAQAGNDPWIKSGTSGRNSMSVYNERETELMPSFVLEYQKKVGDHSFKGMFITESIKWNEHKTNASRLDLLSFEAPYLSFASDEGINNSESETDKGRVSYIGRVNYDYKGKYMLEAAMRADASAYFPENSRWGYFPSVSAAWRMSEESFIKDNIDAINNMKLRASYGILGKDGNSYFDYLTGYNISTGSYIIGGKPEPIIYSAGLANTNVTWETMTMYNVGFDLGLWDGLLGVEADVFYRLRDDILATPVVGIPSTFGADMPRMNLHSTDTRGFDLVLTHRNRIGDFTYDVSPMISWARTKNLEVQDEPSEDPLYNERYMREGEWNDRLWGYVSDGLFMNEDEIANHPVDQDQNGNTTILPGDIKYVDQNGDNIIDWRDQKVIGTSVSSSNLPNWNYSLNLGAEYKGFRLSMLWTGQAGYSITPSGTIRSPFINGSTPFELHYDNRSIVDVDEDGKKYISHLGKLPPINQNGTTANNAKTSDYWTQDAMFIRLRNINLSYALPSNLLSKTGIKNCMVYVAGGNLITFSNLGIFKDAIDPEIPVDKGTDGRYYPPVRTITFGLKLTL